MSQSERAFQQDRVQALMPMRTTLEQERRTFVWLAKRLSIPKSRLMSYVYGYARIPLDVLERACLILNINVSDILGHLEREHLDHSTLLQDAPNGRNRPRTANTTKTLDETGDKTGKAASYDSPTRDYSRARRTTGNTSAAPRRGRAAAARASSTHREARSAKAVDGGGAG